LKENASNAGGRGTVRTLARTTRFWGTRTTRFWGIPPQKASKEKKKSRKRRKKEEKNKRTIL